MKLTRAQRKHARAEFKLCCKALLRNPGAVHYTQGSDRFSGITQNKSPHVPSRLFPFHGDCSSTYTWAMWRALHKLFGIGDRVNGQHWRAGFTGTIAQHGRLVSGRRGTRKVADAVLYGPAPNFEHVTGMFGPGVVFSHGSEAGPFLLKIDYRPDRAQVRRFIR
jgi:hypothetical protein